MAKNKHKLTKRFIDGIKAQTVDNVNSGSLVHVITVVIKAIGRVFKSLEVVLNDALGGN